MAEGRTVSSRQVSIPRRVITLLAVYAVLTAAVLSVLMVYLRTEAIASGQKILAGFAELSGEQTSRALQNIEQTLQAADVIFSDATIVGTATAEQMRWKFRDLIKDRPFLTAIRVIDRQGRIVHGPDAADTGRDVSDRDYFIRQRDDPRSGLLWGIPVKARSTGQWIVTATLPVRDAQGEFNGLIGFRASGVLCRCVERRRRHQRSGNSAVARRWRTADA